MNVFGGIPDREPDFVNDIGVEFWIDKSTTEYAYRMWNFKKDLISVWFVKFPDEKVSRVVIYDNKVIYDNMMVDAVACFIDAYAVANNIKKVAHYM